MRSLRPRAALTANARGRGAPTNVIVLLSDGDAQWPTILVIPTTCLQPKSPISANRAVTAAQNAAKKRGPGYTRSLFNSPTLGFAARTRETYPGGLTKTACHTMAQIANMPGSTAGGTYVNDPTKFYSDNAQGCRSNSNPNITANKNSIFPEHRVILCQPGRLLPSACFVASPPKAGC